MSKFRGNTYAQRARSLKQLGFKSYREYLGSDLWCSVRAKVFQVKGHRCKLCNQEATQVHHNRYLPCDLNGRRLKFLEPMCGKCHKDIEYSDGQKNTVAEAKRAFKRKRRENRKEFEEVNKLTALFFSFRDDETYTAAELRFHAAEIAASNDL